MRNVNIDEMRRMITLADGRVLEAWTDPDESGVPLLFHYGTPSSGLPYEKQVAAARERGLRWVSWSRPGYGASTRQEGRNAASVAADAREVLDQLGAQKAYVGGWSGGGSHALACAALMPDRVLGVFTIASGAPIDAEGLDYTAGMGEENVEGLKVAMEGPEADAVDMEKMWPIFREMQPGNAEAALGDLLSDVDKAANKGEFSEWGTAAIRHGLRDSYLGWLDDDQVMVRPWGFGLDSFAVPVHLFQGAQDRMVPLQHGEWLATHVHPVSAHFMPNDGHFTLMAEHFGEVLDELLR